MEEIEDVKEEERDEGQTTLDINIEGKLPGKSCSGGTGGLDLDLNENDSSLDINQPLSAHD